MQLVTVRTSRLPCAGTVKKKVDLCVPSQRHKTTDSLPGHITSKCTNNKVFDLDEITTLPIEEAWANVVKTAKEAVETRDLDEFRDVRGPPIFALVERHLLSLSLY